MGDINCTRHGFHFCPSQWEFLGHGMHCVLPSGWYHLASHTHAARPRSVVPATLANVCIVYPLLRLQWQCQSLFARWEMDYTMALGLQPLCDIVKTRPGTIPAHVNKISKHTSLPHAITLADNANLNVELLQQDTQLEHAQTSGSVH